MVLSTFLVSHEICAKEKQNIAVLKELYTIVLEIIGLLRFQSADVYQICSACFENKRLLDYSSFKNIDFSFSEKWENACFETLQGVNQETYDLFSEVGKVLGNYDAETQISRLEYIAETIKSQYVNANQEHKNRQKIYYTFGFFSGTIICIFLV